MPIRYHIAERLSERLAETPEGFLLCRDVPIARTGWLEYGPGEVPVEALDGADRVLIYRDEGEVFSPEAVASFEGKPAVVDHPDEDVTPLTWRSVAVGHAQNVRRGEGAQSDLLLADLLITDQEAIDLVRGGLRDISCGYDADYEQDAPGRGQQRNIRGNHIALVTRGRCGPRCRINDNHKDNAMSSTKTKEKFADRLARLFGRPEVRKVLDSMEEPEEARKEPPAATDGDPDRLTSLEGQVQELTVLVRQLVEASQGAGAETGDEDPDAKSEDEDAPDEGGEKKDPPVKTGDAARKTRDVRTVDQDTAALAAVLYPGILVRDSDNRCAVMRLALRAASKDKAVDGIVRAALRGSALDSCDCLTLDAAFAAAGEFVKAKNNLKTADGLAKASARDFGKSVTPAQINQQNRDFHAKKGA